MSDEEVVMTPTKKGNTTHIRIEKRKKLDFSGDDQTVHVAGGQHKGLVVNKQISDDADLGRPQLQIGFNCFLVDQKTEKRVVESRRLKFWYVDDTGYLDQVTTAYEFFKELVQPANFPRDYVGFIKKCMKQMQKNEYKLAKKIDLEIRQLSDQEAPLTPGSNVDDFFGIAKEDKRPIEEIVREKILQVLESAYPNVLEVEDLVRITAADEAIINQQLEELKAKNLVREMENGKVVRHVLEDDKTETEVQMVQHMPRIAANQQPTIAIITANYCEKLAVDAMMDNKTTFVKYKTEGESNVYTVGFIGEHKCVSTKLPQIGQSRAAQISSGNTTTRLLGTFQNIEHVFVVGVAGGVPHYTNFYKHVRLGDIVISRCNDKGYFYYHVDKILQDKEGNIQYKMRTWSPRDLSLQRVAEKIEENCTRKPEKAPWERYIHEGQTLLEKQEADFNRPPKESDRLYMSIGEENVIEVQHPDRPEEAEVRENVPTVRCGVVGSGRPITKYDNTRLEFAHNYGITCFDSEYDQVIESIVGNRKDSFMFIRGIADYNDGSKNKEWQPYASLAAAAMMKTIVKMISNPYLSEDDD